MLAVGSTRMVLTSLVCPLVRYEYTKTRRGWRRQRAHESHERVGVIDMHDVNLLVGPAECEDLIANPLDVQTTS